MSESLIKNDDFRNVFRNIRDAGTRSFLINKFTHLIRFYDLNSPQSFKPFVTGYNLILMTTGPWFDDYKSLISSGHKYGLSTLTQKFGNELEYFKNNFPILARNINIPEPTKEYQNVSTRSSSITHYIREIDLPDFSVDYVDDQDLTNLKYHENWYKMIELYRRGVPELSESVSTNRSNNLYFYDVPYLNGIWVLGFTPAFDIRYMFYMPGVRPVNLPLKSLISNRGDQHIINYSIQYKGTKLFYKFISGNEEFSELIRTAKTNNILIEIFKKLFFQNQNNILNR